MHSTKGRFILSKINKSDIYEKNLNFLLGSGASYGLLPTLALQVKENGSDKAHTVETLATKYENNADFLAHLFSWYVHEVILPAAEYDPGNAFFNTAPQDAAVENYRQFLETILKILSKKSHKKRVNIWTCHALVPPQVLVYATFRSKATGLFQPSAEWRRRGL
ncbi:hypothetical protein ACW9UM_09050 [Marinovum sp. KMM 9989]